MTDPVFLLVTIIGVVYFFFGALFATVDISNREILLPRDLKSDGYNRFGSWTIFIFRSIAAFPFWILGTIIYLGYKFVMWLFTVGADKT